VIHARRAFVGFAALAALAAFLGAALAQPIERNAKGRPDTDIQVGVFVNVLPDCSSGPLPTIRLAAAPAHGRITVRKGAIHATNFRQCLALEVPAYVAVYRSSPGFIGDDHFTIEVKFAGGRTETQKFTVTIDDPALGPRI